MWSSVISGAENQILTLSTLSKNICRRHFEIFFILISRKLGFDTSCKLSPPLITHAGFYDVSYKYEYHLSLYPCPEMTEMALIECQNANPKTLCPWDTFKTVVMSPVYIHSGGNRDLRLAIKR